MKASTKLNSKLQTVIDTLKLTIKENRLPNVTIGAEYRERNAVDWCGPHPNPIANCLESELLKIAPLGQKGIDNYVGCCCEVRSSNKVLLKESGIRITDIIFTDAIRPRTLEIIKRCQNCKIIFGNGI